MMRIYKIGLALLFIAPLGACQSEPENVQTRAENTADALENGYQILEAEAENSIADAAAPIENEADMLLNRIDGNEAEPAVENRQ